jgi:exodeoxyribonuclease VII large subunit
LSEPTSNPIFAVSEFLEISRSLLENRFPQVAVRGEITNFKAASSGHMYFSLKDDKGRLDCAFFRGYNQGLAFKPGDGLQVVVGGTATLYEARGQFQLSARWMEPAGLGAQQLAFEQLKKKLQEEGLFDPSRKRTLPAYPRRVAVVTSAEGAAWRDFLKILETRVAVEEVDLYDVRVQGVEAVRDVTEAFRRIADWPEYDVVVLTRGGGSAEDLAAFNDETVVRAVAACPIPVLCAVGHEIDTTLCDYAADKRAPTPTAAAEWLAPDREEVARQVAEWKRRLGEALGALLEGRRGRIEALENRLGDFHPLRRLNEDRQRVDESALDLEREFRNLRTQGRERLSGMGRALQRAVPLERLSSLRARVDSGSRGLRQGWNLRVGEGQSRLQGTLARFESLHPLAPLKRGYAVVSRKKDGKILRSRLGVPPGEILELRLSDGKLEAEVRDSPSEEERLS